MDDRKKPRLGTVQEILLIPLYARAVENRKEHALLRDARAEEIVASIDYDFERFDGLPSLTGALLRTPPSSTGGWRTSCPRTPTPPWSRSAPDSTHATNASTTAAPGGSTSTCPM